ncbi:MAG: hypothetical protein GY940_43110 [bacterium]|nr:hypothetical protein [bacterium]
MSIRGRTLLERGWPDTDNFTAVARNWQNDASTILLSYIWKGYDLLKDEVLSRIQLNNADDELERAITQLLEPKIRKAMTGDEPFYVQHEVYEYETRQPPPAQPPQYDIAFVLNENPRIMWPLEAKVLRSDGSVAPYINDIKNEFLSCRYAPFSNGGAMLGYLFSGIPRNVFHQIEKKIPCKLHHHLDFSERDHRYSDHNRAIPIGKRYPSHFRCQHLIFRIENKMKN